MILEDDILTAGRQRLAVSRFLVCGNGQLARQVNAALQAAKLETRVCIAADNLIGLFSAHDAVIDAACDAALSTQLNIASLRAQTPLIHASPARITTFMPPHTPCYSCMTEVVVADGQATDAAIRMIVNEAARSVLGRPALAGLIWENGGTVPLQKQLDCPACSKYRAITPASGASPVCSVTQPQAIDAAAAKDMHLIDVRELHEWEQGHMNGAEHLPFSVLMRNPAAFIPPASGQPCALYGRHSLRAAEILLMAGYTDIYSLKSD